MNLARPPPRSFLSSSRRLTTTTTTTTGHNSTRDQLRALLRETAQPVAVITSVLHSDPSKDVPSPYHGATLSSFTSLALDPFPLVTFSLRIPSRMATSLKSAPPHVPSHMVINILSAAQASTAIAFSRPDLHREPFVTVPYFLSEDGVPILQGSLGALSCRLVSRLLPLHDLDLLERGFSADDTKVPTVENMASELFIARVVRVEGTRRRGSHGSDSPWTLPLLYHRRVFTSCDTRSQEASSTTR